MAEITASIAKVVERPPPRQWKRSEKVCMRDKNPSGMSSIMSSNVLSDRYAKNEHVKGYDGSFLNEGEINNYGHCSKVYLDWEHRKRLLVREIQAIDPDVACLQEVEEKQFTTFFSKQLSKLGYKVYFLYKK